jgi:hypothetical protein
MALYELRTYTLRVGAMAEAVKLYQELGFPALQKGGQDKKLVGYFQSDTGTINQPVHLWKFDDDADRRAHWAAVYANKDFVEGFASKFRPLLMTQEVKLLQAAPWGPPDQGKKAEIKPEAFTMLDDRQRLGWSRYSMVLIHHHKAPTTRKPSFCRYRYGCVAPGGRSEC